MDQLESQLGAAQVTLTRDILDRIDEIVPPGTTIAPADRGYTPEVLSRPDLRRRPSGLVEGEEGRAPVAPARV
jgi:hypothetical protein